MVTFALTCTVSGEYVLEPKRRDRRRRKRSRRSVG